MLTRHNPIEEDGNRSGGQRGRKFPPKTLAAWLIEKYFVVQFYCSLLTHKKDTYRHRKTNAILNS